MKKVNTLIFVSLLLLSVMAVTAMAFPANDNATNQIVAAKDKQTHGNIVIANRASGTISIIDAHTNQVINTVGLPNGDNSPEPMYVVYVHNKNRVFVGDRANNRVVAFDAHTFEVVGTVPAGNGVFHMWANGRRLWVNNDIDKTVTVINTKKLQAIATVPMPDDLVADGGKPHDIILDKDAAYVTMVGFSRDHHYIVKFDRKTYQEVARAPVGKDPHVILTKKNDKLYVASQGSNIVQVLNRHDLAQVDSVGADGAHGVWIPRHGKTLYVINLPNGGTDGLFTVDLGTNTVIGQPVDTPFPVPHNLVATKDNRKLYVTHSGAEADKVTVYAISKKEPIPVLLGDVTVGKNPFGLAFVP